MSGQAIYTDLKPELNKIITESTVYDKSIGTEQPKIQPNLILNSKSNRVDELANSLQETVRDQIGVFLFIKNIQTSKIEFITNDFWLTSMQFSYKERVQVMEGFNSSNFSFFGDNIRLYNFSAITIDGTSTDEFDPGKLYYQSSILKLYSEHLRGTKLMEKNYIAVLVVANHIIEGYPLNLTVAYSADSEPLTQFSFNFLVTNHLNDLDGVLNEARLAKMYSTEPRKLSEVDTKNLNAYKEYINKLNKLKTIKTSDFKTLKNIKKLPSEIELANISNFTVIEQSPAVVAEIVKYINDECLAFLPEGAWSYSYLNIESILTEINNRINQYSILIQDIYLKNTKLLYK